MSYILEALRKADAERDRERGAVPGLNAQPLSGERGDAAARGGSTWSWAAAGAVVAVLGFASGLAWWSLARTGPTAPVPAAAPRAAAPAVAAPPAASVAAVVPAVPATVAAEPPPPPAAAKPVPPPPVRPPVVARTVPTSPPRAAAAPAAPPRAASAALRPAAKVPVASAPTVAASAASAPAGESRVLTLADLPEDVRRSLPPLAIGGLVYSDSAASRFVILNGQVFHEGSRPAEGVLLEQIRRKSAVLLHRGYRVELTY